MRTGVAVLLSMLAGYLSLSQEILWFRLISYGTGGSPFAFAHLLGGFLFGLAIGALCATSLSKSTRYSRGLVLAGLFLACGLLPFFSMPSTANMLALIGDGARYYSYFTVALVALPSGLIFPLLCHYAVDSFGEVGFSMSWLYFWNVVGASLGPIVTTFILMDVLQFSSILLIITGGAFLASALSVVALPCPAITRAGILCGLLGASALVAGIAPSLYLNLFEKLHFKQEMSAAHPYRILNESRSGIIAVGGADGDDVIFGGGVYDGSFNLDPMGGGNGILRAYLVPALHRNPQRVLEIGLSSGSWTRVLANHPAIREVTVVEINPNYASIIQGYPSHSTIFRDPKITIHVDDGRRWLNRNPDRRFDVIVMNTTFHWRSHSTQLLSQDFLRLCQRHLNPGGVVYLNTTGSSDVRFTVAQTFRHLISVSNFAAGSDAPFDMTEEERVRSLLAFELPAELGSDPLRARARETLSRWATQPLLDEASALRSRTDLRVVTDDNMVTEFKSDWVLLDPARSWRSLAARLFAAER